MNRLKIAGFSLTLTGALLLQGCGGGGGSGSNGIASSVSTSVSSSLSSVASSSSSSKPVASAAEAQLGIENLSPDSGIAAANTLAAEDFSPENTQASTVLAAGDLSPP